MKCGRWVNGSVCYGDMRPGSVILHLYDRVLNGSRVKSVSVLAKCNKCMQCGHSEVSFSMLMKEKENK